MFVGIFLYGLNDHLRGPLLPSLRAEFGLDYQAGGLLMMGTPLGAILSAFSCGILLKKWGFRPLFLLSGAFIFSGYGGFLFFKSLPLIWLSLFSVGLGLGALQLLTNTVLIQAFPQTKARVLSYAALFFSAGATSGPLIALATLDLDYSWRLAFLPSGALSLVYLLSFFSPKTILGQKTIDHLSWPHALIRTQNFWIFGGMFVGYSGIEIGFASWLVSFLQGEKGFNNTQSQSLFTLYLVCVVIGRFIGSLYLDRVGLKRSLTIHLSIYCLALTLLIHTGAVNLSLGLCGLALSIFFPAATAMAEELFGEEAEKALGFAFGLAGAGGVIGLYAVGWMGSQYGLFLGMHTLLALACLLLLFTTLLKVRK